MTVGELIEELQKIKDKDLDVLTDNYWAISCVSVQREPEDVAIANIKKGETVAYLHLND